MRAVTKEDGTTELVWDFQKDLRASVALNDGSATKVFEVRGDGKSALDDDTYPMLIDGRDEQMRQYGHLNVKHHTYFKPGEYACTPANQALLASGEVVPVYVPA